MSSREQQVTFEDKVRPESTKRPKTKRLKKLVRVAFLGFTILVTHAYTQAQQTQSESYQTEILMHDQESESQTEKAMTLIDFPSNIDVAKVIERLGPDASVLEHSFDYDIAL